MSSAQTIDRLGSSRGPTTSFSEPARRQVGLLILTKTLLSSLRGTTGCESLCVPVRLSVPSSCASGSLLLNDTKAGIMYVTPQLGP